MQALSIVEKLCARGLSPTSRTWGAADEARRGAMTQNTAIAQRVAITCAQIATMPKNRASDASVAASSTTARTMTHNSTCAEREVNIVHDMFACQVGGNVTLDIPTPLGVG